MKPRYKRLIFWSTLSLFCTAALAVVLVPPFITLNYLKPKIEASITAQTGFASTIQGDINFSLIGHATLVAHDVVIPSGTIQSALFTVPFSSIFNLQSAPLTGDIFVYGGRIKISQMTPPKFDNSLEIRNSVIEFMGKDYEIVQGSLSGGIFKGTVRTDQHKYEFTSNGDEFQIKNNANDLDISGRLYSDGSAHGTMSLTTNNINKWFDFSEPKIRHSVTVAMDFDWNGQYGFKFSNIRGDNFTGNIELFEDGHRNIILTSKDMDFDFSFLLNPTNIFYNTTFDLNFYGRLTLANHVFKHLQINASGTGPDSAQGQTLRIKKIVADNVILTGGEISESGARDILIQMPINGIATRCMFSGTPENWKCSQFQYGDIQGSMSVQDGIFNVFVQSDRNLPDISEFSDALKRLGHRGQINFQFADIGGSMMIDNSKFTPSYEFARNKSLEWLEIDLYFLPESMRTATGNFVWDKNGLSFVPHSKRWKLNISDSLFYISGINAKDWFPNLDLQSLNNFNYTISGNVKGQNISNLEIKVADHVFTGSATKNNLTLVTNLLNIDSFINQRFIDGYEESQFLTTEPLLIPFGLPVNISLSAKTLIHSGNEYSNFVYSLKSGVQTFSITDSERGSLLATLSKERNQYQVSLKLNKFLIYDSLLSSTMPLNIKNTMITAEASLSTSGQIAYDIWQNLAGKIDLSFDGGTITGFGIDDFYTGTDNITTLNAEYFLANSLEGGTSTVKEMRIIGDYDGGNFSTTIPFTLSMRHADAIGNLEIIAGQMSADIDLVLRGTSPLPSPISIQVLPDGHRDYSLSQIMINFDPDFLRDFVATHNRF